MKLKFYSPNQIWFIILSLTLDFCQGSKDASYYYAIEKGDYPFLVLLKVKTSSDGVQFGNGCLMSLSWVLSLSCLLYKATKEPPTPDAEVSVFAGLVSMKDTGSAPSRRAIRIVPDELVSSNQCKNGPCLVLLQLESAFLENNWIRPAALNSGMLSAESQLVGWAWDLDVKNNFSRAVSLKVASLSTAKCHDKYKVVHCKREMCAYETDELPLTVREGALLVDNGYLTALKYEDTNVLSPKSTFIIITIRLYWFISWIQYYVVDDIPKTSFIETNNTEDDLFHPPRFNKRSKSLNASVKLNAYLAYTVTVVIIQLMQQWTSAAMLQHLVWHH
ncbi:uncharacterized protein LOC124361763 [Homalodisca vitripennis]|uniref:uncharacterized protein LOC124361763 n=1 Tax=Homalodisca vitripennis TaxID=197043 RepID=UPI001EEB97F0|nr:uncharacterized protein LOC124361763 [Homalodisca vitripennis]